MLGKLNRELRHHERGGVLAISKAKVFQDGLKGRHNVLKLLGAKSPKIRSQFRPDRHDPTLAANAPQPGIVATVCTTGDSNIGPFPA